MLSILQQDGYFFAAVEAQNYGELYERLKRVLSSEISIKNSTDSASWNTGSNTVKVTVSKDGASKTYTVTVTKGE